MAHPEGQERNYWQRNRWWIILTGVPLAFLSFMWLVTYRANIEAGHEGVIIDRPFWTIFADGGVRAQPLEPGSKWLFYTSQVFQYDMRPFQFTESFDDEKDGTITADNVPIDFSAFIKVRPIKGKAPQLHTGFGDQWYGMNLKQQFRTSVRDEVARASMTALTTRQLNAEGKDILGVMQQTVHNEMKTFVEQKGVPVEVMEVIIGKATPPKRILESLAATADQQQRSKTEDERANAEIKRKRAETERAAADNAYRNSIGLSPAQFVQLELAKRQVEAVQACAANAANANKDRLPADCTVVIGDLGGAQPAITLK